jgi:putative membrane protein
MATGTVSAVIRAHQRRLVTFAISLVFAVAALPALAQQQESTQNVLPPPYYGYGHMMWGGPGPGWGWHPFMIVGPIFAVLAVIGTVVIFVWLVRWATHGFPFHRHGLHHFYGRGAALDILEERFARGEIDKAEFEDKRKTIGRRHQSRTIAPATCPGARLQGDRISELSQHPGQEAVTPGGSPELLSQ